MQCLGVSQMGCPFRDRAAQCPFASALIAQHGESYAMEVFHGMKSEIEALHTGKDELLDLASVVHGPRGIAPLPTTSVTVPNSSSCQREHGSCPPTAPAVPLATISMGGFGNFLRFDPFGKNGHRRPPRKRHENIRGEPAGPVEQQGAGSCPIGSAFAPVTRVAAALTAALGSRLRTLRCPAPIVAMRAAVAKTPLAAELRRQVLPTKLISVGAMAMGEWPPLTESQPVVRL